MDPVQVVNMDLVALLKSHFERCWAAGVDTWDPANMIAGGIASTTIAVTGARVGDPAVASLATIGVNDVMISAHVQAADTVRVILLNLTGGALDIASGTLTAVVRVRY